MQSHPFLSKVALSCLFTKGVAAKQDPRQKVLPSYGVPDLETRRLLAKLILEEAEETIEALGFFVYEEGDCSLGVAELTGRKSDESDLEKVIDGCCDTIYVATGCLVACGVPDLPHLAEVCRANNQKFPGGVAIINPDTGKYLKPPLWSPPDHTSIEVEMRGTCFDMVAVQEFVVRDKEVNW